MCGVIFQLLTRCQADYVFQNLAILCANVKPDYPATRVQMPTGKSVYTPYGFACAWIQQAGRTEPKVAISCKQ